MQGANWNTFANPGLFQGLHGSQGFQGLHGPGGPGGPGGPDTTLTISFGNTGGAGGGSITLDLAIPGLGLNDATPAQLANIQGALNNFIQAPIQGFVLAQGLMDMSKALGQMADAIKEGGPQFLEQNQGAVNKFMGTMVQNLGVAQESMKDLVYNSTYPDYTDFLKLMLKVGEDLRQTASNMQLASAQADYNNLMMQSSQLQTIATDTYNATMDNIHADQMSAAFSIAGGLASALGPIGGEAGMAVGSGVGKIVEGIGNLGASSFKTEGASEQLAADMGQAALKSLEAGEKLITENGQIAQDLKDQAQKLLDSILQMQGNLISAQNQVLQGLHM